MKLIFIFHFWRKVTFTDKLFVTDCCYLHLNEYLRTLTSVHTTSGCHNSYIIKNFLHTVEAPEVVFIHGKYHSIIPTFIILKIKIARGQSPPSIQKQILNRKTLISPYLLRFIVELKR